MRVTKLIVLFKRSSFIFLALWILFGVYEQTTRSYYSNDVSNRLPLSLEVEKEDEKGILIRQENGNQLIKGLNVEETGKELRTKNNGKLPEKIAAMKGIAGNITETLGNNSVQETNRNKQLEKFDGIVIQKKPPEFYALVALPPFNDKRDPLGPGEMGKGVKIDINKLSEEEKSKYHKGWKSNSFNQYVSDLISVHRDLPDGRSDACIEQVKEYGPYLQEVSVVIIFHNEAWSVLLRSVHSILSRTPNHLIKEIILVDDFSTNDDLKDPLEKYFNDFPKVQIVRATKRQGLTRARLLGYYQSTAPIVVFLDSHIECFPGWAEPLIASVSHDPTTVVFPNIENIRDEDLSTSCTSISQYCIFKFRDLSYDWQYVPQAEMARRKSDADPIRSPTMPGGLFAISREFFDRIGTYDPGLDYWGGENIELSFKTWMCGGTLEIVTCSHVGHIFRKVNPNRWTHDIGNKNSVRVAEVWMDAYKNYYYERILFNLGDYGNVTERKSLREQLNCKSFQWYLQNVYPSIELPSSNISYAGEIRSFSRPRCVDTMGGPKENQTAPKMYPCHKSGSNQFWYVGAGQIFQDDVHICVSDGEISLKKRCQPSGQTWKYKEDQTLLHIPTNTCLTANVTGDSLTIENCANNSYQKWLLQPRRSDLTFPVLR